MHVDRSRFLFLAGAIATACTGSKPANDPPATPVASNSVAPTATVDDPPSKPFSGGWKGGHPGGEYGHPVGEGYYPPGEGYSSDEGGIGTPPTLAKQGIHWWNWKCGNDDSSGSPAKCNVTVPKSCAPFPFIDSSCRGAIKYFKPKIAERSVECIHALKPQGVCGAMSYDCKDAALKSACADASADADCTKIVASCKKATMASCRKYMNGLNAGGRASVVACMSAKNGCSYGIYSCIESLND